MTYCKLYPDANVCKTTDAEEPVSSDECPNAPTNKNNEYGQKCCLDTRYSSLAVCQEPNDDQYTTINAHCGLSGTSTSGQRFSCYVEDENEDPVSDYTLKIVYKYVGGVYGITLECNGSSWQTYSCSDNEGCVAATCSPYLVILGIKSCELYDKNNNLIGKDNYVKENYGSCDFEYAAHQRAENCPAMNASPSCYISVKVKK